MYKICEKVKKFVADNWSSIAVSVITACILAFGGYSLGRAEIVGDFLSNGPGKIQALERASVEQSEALHDLLIKVTAIEAATNTILQLVSR